MWDLLITHKRSFLSALFTRARARTHTHARARAHTHTHTRAHTHTHTRTHARTHTHTHVGTHVGTHARGTHARTHTLTHAHKHTLAACTLARTHARAHTHTRWIKKQQNIDQKYIAIEDVTIHHVIVSSISLKLVGRSHCCCCHLLIPLASQARQFTITSTISCSKKHLIIIIHVIFYSTASHRQEGAHRGLQLDQRK